ncbi:MAG: rRNA pseudouridine synthase [Clostridia bacterium]|nr:rRNA pseudouridine synthase [Clostridia bacterium]
MEKVRLQKYIADCGLMSRRAAEKEIEAGNVTVNGVTATIGESVTPRKDKVCLNGEPVVFSKRYLYYLLNKPQGVVTTMSDEFGRRTVRDLLPTKERVYPVGRLDKDSEGLLLCTNDGDLANKLMHPAYHLKKTYIVNVRGHVEGSLVDSLRAMRTLEEEPIAPVEVTLVNRSENASALRFVLSEGKNRQIRRMCESVGLSVMQLRRVSIGGININGLEVGAWRHLTAKELSELKAAVEKKGREKNGKGNTRNRYRKN